MTRRCDLAALAAAFEGFLIDQYGVLRDEAGAYPGARAALALLRDRGKRTVILSNSGRSAADNAARLARIGLGPDLYDAVVTSGEVAHDLLVADPPPPGTRVFEIASGAPTDLPERLGLPRCDGAAEAGLVLISGAETERVGLDAYRARLAPAAARGVPAICTNPDLVKLGPGGALLPGAGALADLYAALGGPVRRIGKPHGDIYAAALARLPGVPRDRVLCLGDSPAHDIAGARAARLASCLVETGVSADGRAEDGPAADFVLAAFAP